MTEALKPRPIPEIMTELQAAVDEASLRYGYIADTIRVNAMRHGATSEQIEAFVHGRASFIEWLAKAIEVRRLSDALAIPEVAALVDAVDRLPAGTWEVWTSNSYRRITASHDGRHGPDGGVLHGTIQPSDGHPDLSMSADQLQAICELVNGVRALRKIKEGRG